jgi:hypothetical protein
MHGEDFADTRRPVVYAPAAKAILTHMLSEVKNVGISAHFFALFVKFFCNKT